MTSPRTSGSRARRTGVRLAVATSALALTAPLLGALPATAAPGATPGLARPAAPAAPTIDQVNARLDSLGQQVEQAAEEYNVARERLASIAIKVRAAQTRVQQQQAVIASTRTQLAHLASTIYRQGQLGALEVALGDDPDALLARAGLGTTVADRQAVLVSDLERQEAGLAEDQQRVLAEQEAAKQVQARLAASKQTAEAQVAAMRAELARLQAEQRRALERAARQRERRALAAAAAAAPAAAQERPASTSSSRGGGRSGGSSDGGESVTVGAGGTVNCGGRILSAPNARAAKALAYGCAQLGEPYLWGADGPSSWDCSGFTMKSWGAAGVSLPHSSRMQYSYGTRVSRDDLQPGDLVFFYSPISHVGMYVGGGQMIAAPSSGSVVKISSILNNYVGAVRL